MSIDDIISSGNVNQMRDLCQDLGLNASGNMSELRARLDERATIGRYFEENYDQGKRYEVPTIAPRSGGSMTIASGFSLPPSMSHLIQSSTDQNPWLDWMEEYGMNKKILDKRKMLPSGDLRISVREEQDCDYLFKAYLQYEYERMILGRRSVKIFVGDTRLQEQREYEEKLEELSEMVKDHLEVVLAKDEVLRKSNTQKVLLTLKDLLLLDKVKHRGSLNQGPAEFKFAERFSQQIVKLLFTLSKIRLDKTRDALWRYARDNKKGGLQDLAVQFGCPVDVKDTREDIINNLEKYDQEDIREKIPDYFRIKISLFEYSLRDNLAKSMKDWFLETIGEWWDIKRGSVTTLGKQIFDKFTSVEKQRMEEISQIHDDDFRIASTTLSILFLCVISSKGIVTRRTGLYSDYVLHTTQKQRDENKRTDAYPNTLHFTDEFKQTITKSSFSEFQNKNQHAIYRVLRPEKDRWMYCRPEDHVVGKNGVKKGGYLIPPSEAPNHRTTVSNQWKYEEILDEPRLVPSEDSCDALNILQKTQWELNLDLIDQIFSLQRDESRLIQEVKVKDSVEYAFYPEDETSTEFAQMVQRQHWIRKIIDNNANVFWHAWAFDWRGRMSPISRELSPQDSDIDKALIRFKEWKPIGDSGLRWFKIFLYNFFAGKDDPSGLWTEPPKKMMSFDHREKWVNKNREALLRVANEWSHDQYRELLDLDKRPHAKSVTFQRLAALFEFERLYVEHKKSRDWKHVTSGHPVFLDASANGYQHLSLLLNSKALAKKVNVLDSGNKPQDLYNEVAKEARAEFDGGPLEDHLSDKLGFSQNKVGEFRKLAFVRKLAKPPTMVTLYGASDLEKCFNSRDGKSKPGYYDAIRVENTSKDRLAKMKKNELMTLATDHELSGYSSLNKDDLISRLLNENTILAQHPPIVLYKCPKCKFEHSDKQEVVRHARKRDVNDKTHMKICWHDDSYLHKEMGPTRPLEIQKQHHQAITKTTKTAAPPDGFGLVDIYKKAVDEVTDGTFDTLDTELGDSIESKKSDIGKIVTSQYGVKKRASGFSWSLPDGATVNFYYSKDGWRRNLEDIRLPAMLSIFPLLQGTKSNTVSILDAIHRNKDGIEIDNDLIDEALENFGKDEQKLQRKCDEIVTEMKMKEFKGMKNTQLKALLKKKDLSMQGKKDEMQRRLAKNKKTGDKWNWLAQKTNGGNMDFFRAIRQEVFARLKKKNTHSVEDIMMSMSLTISQNQSFLTGEKDLKKMKSGIAANFIHSLDAAHMRNCIVSFDSIVRNNTDSNTSFWAVHDAFGTHACDMDTLVEVVGMEFLSLHSQGDLGHWLNKMAPNTKNFGDNNFRSEINNRSISISKYLLN